MSKVCARCGKKLPADPDRRVYSRFTKLRYCADLAECTKRARRKAKAA